MTVLLYTTIKLLYVVNMIQAEKNKISKKIIIIFDVKLL